MEFRKQYLFSLIIPVAFFTSSCSNKSAKADEPKVVVMDSVSTELEKTNSDLDDKTAKLEASLEEANKLETTK